MAKLTVFAAVLLLAPWAVSVYASAPPPLNCNNVITDMIDCVDFVVDGSKETKPSSECCVGLKTVVGVSPTCLCQALQTAANMGYEVNMTRAGALTKTCNMDVPDFNGCGRVGTPAPAPAPALTSPSPSPSPSPSGYYPAPLVSPPLPTPEPPVPLPPSPAPSPAALPVSPPLPSQPSPAPEIPPVSPPLPSQPSPAPEIPPVGSPVEAEAPSSVSASSRASSPLKLIAGVAAAGFALFVAV